MENFKVAEGHENDHIFVRGKTKPLSQLNASEAAVLAKNGDKRIAPVAETAVVAISDDIAPVSAIEAPEEDKPKKSRNQNTTPTHE